MGAITIIKQNAKNIPKQVRFCPRVPLKYTETLNEYIKTQGQIRLLKDKNGTPIARTKLSTNKGHLILEKSDRIAETFGPYYPIQTFIPEASDGILSISPTKPNKTHTLIQCRWKDPVSPTTKQEILTHLKDADVEYASFNHTSHLLNITTKFHNHDKITNHIRLNPTINALDNLKIAHLNIRASGQTLVKPQALILHFVRKTADIMCKIKAWGLTRVWPEALML